jgi:Na+-driven multidrug efflux pump
VLIGCFYPAALNPKEPQVFAYAVEYIRIRSWGIMAAMLGFVASGTYRGIKDTATPLKAAMIAAATNLVLTPLLIIGGSWVQHCCVETAWFAM